MWVLLIIIFNQPYHVDKVDILGTYFKKAVCEKHKQHAMTIGTIARTSFGCVKIIGIKRLKKVSRETNGGYK